MKKEEWCKSLKSGEDLTEFFRQMHKPVIVQMLEGEFDSDLEFDYHNKSSTSNSRNSFQRRQ